MNFKGNIQASQQSERSIVSDTGRANALLLYPSYSHYTTVSNINIAPIGYVTLTTSNNHSNTVGHIKENKSPNGWTQLVKHTYHEPIGDSFLTSW